MGNACASKTQAAQKKQPQKPAKEEPNKIKLACLNYSGVQESPY